MFPDMPYQRKRVFLFFFFVFLDRGENDRFRKFESDGEEAYRDNKWCLALPFAFIEILLIRFEFNLTV